MARAGKRIVVALFLLVIVTAAFFAFAFWRSKQVSPQFVAAGKSSYFLIRDCDNRISQAGSSFVSCVREAEDAVLSLSKMAITQQERMEYAALHGYLTEVSECRRDWEATNTGRDAATHKEILADYRDRLAKTYK